METAAVHKCRRLPRIEVPSRLGATQFSPTPNYITYLPVSSTCAKQCEERAVVFPLQLSKPDAAWVDGAGETIVLLRAF